MVTQGIGGSQADEGIPESGHPGPDALVVQAAKQELSATDQWLVEFLRVLDESSICTHYEGVKDIDRLRLSLAQCTPFMRVGKIPFDLGIT